MIKPIGNQLLIKVEKSEPNSGIVVPEHVQTSSEIKAVVEEIGTTCSMGVRKGHQVMFKAGAQGVELEKDLHLIHENHIAAVLNWTEEDNALHLEGQKDENCCRS